MHQIIKSNQIKFIRHKLSAQYNSFIKHSSESYKWTCVQSATTSTHTWSRMVTPLLNRGVRDVLVKVERSLHQAFLKVVDVMNLCFIHALLYNTPNK